MKCLVTGAAGFIGSHLSERLLTLGHEVVGVDAFVSYYPRAIKERNLAAALGHGRFTLAPLDLRTDALDACLAGADVVFHLAAMPGLVRSWSDLDGYWTCNVLATKRLVDAIRDLGPRQPKLICASTSSVYGRFASGDESLPVRPISPYGVTKLAAENLCRSYEEAFGLPVTVLRYFSVYGPRQRPDMGYHRFIQALLAGEPVTVYGGGQQVRGNTYVSDCVNATIAALDVQPGEVYNVGGGETANVWDILERLERIAGRKPAVRREAARPGDQQHTFADVTKLKRHVGWEPRVQLDEGLALQFEWQRAGQLAPGATRA